MKKEKKNMDFFTGKMFFRLLLPSLISYAGLALGDVADAIVVGQRMGVTGLAAVSLALPVYMFINVIMHGFGAGGSVVYARLLAEGKPEEAIKRFNSVLRTAFVLGVMFAILGNLFLTPLLRILGTTPADGILFQTSQEYIGTIVSGFPLFLTAYILNYYLRNDGSERIASVGFTVANCMDIVLNIVFVLVLDWGAVGAAYSTVIGQAIAICFYLPCIIKRKGFLRFTLQRGKIKDTFYCFRIGFSTSVQYIFSMIFLLVANNLLMRISKETGVAVFDMIQNVSFLILYLYEGTAKAAQPLISTYCGERNQDGQRRVLFLSMISGITAGGITALLIALFPTAMCRIFGITDLSAVELGSLALRIYCVGSLFAGVNLLLENNLQAQEKERGAVAIAFLRGAVVLIPCTFLFSCLGIYGFWWLFPATEVITLCSFLVWWSRKRQEEVFEQKRVYSCTISNTISDMERIMDEMEDFCNGWNAAPKQTYFVRMTLEEICVAIMRQLEKTEDGYIQITLLALEDGVFELHIRDNAVSFNPFELHTDKVNEEGSYDMDAMGILVIKNRAKDFFYRRYQGFNTLVVRI